VHETGYTIRILFCTITYTKELDPNFENVVAPLEWAKGSTSSIVVARWRQCALMEEHIGATWRIRLNRLSAAGMRPYVKLFRPLVIKLTLINACQMVAYRKDADQL